MYHKVFIKRRDTICIRGETKEKEEEKKNGKDATNDS